MTIRKTYELPAPSKIGELSSPSKTTTYSEWYTRQCSGKNANSNPAEVDGQSYGDGIISHFPDKEFIQLDMRGVGFLSFDYDEAKQAALAMLAAVEEAEANQYND